MTNEHTTMLEVDILVRRRTAGDRRSDLQHVAAVTGDYLGMRVGRFSSEQQQIEKEKTEMDDKLLQESRKKLAALDKQLADLAVKQRSTEGRLAGEHEIIRKAAAQRAGLVAQLIDAAPEQAAKVHKQIDGLDSQIKGAERMAESFQRLLQTIAGDLAEVTGQRDRVNALVGQEQNARAFAAWQVEMAENFKAAALAMANARIILGKLTTEAARGGERFGGPAHTWAAGEFDKFEHVEANPDTLGGFRQALPWYRNVLIHIAPMTRG